MDIGKRALVMCAGRRMRFYSLNSAELCPGESLEHRVENISDGDIPETGRKAIALPTKTTEAKLSATQRVCYLGTSAGTLYAVSLRAWAKYIYGFSQVRCALWSSLWN